MVTPFPYYINHAIVAVLIMLPIAALSWWGASASSILSISTKWKLCILCGACSGFFFYLGREIAQWEDKAYFDWPGILAPAIAMLLISILAFYMRPSQRQ